MVLFPEEVSCFLRRFFCMWFGHKVTLTGNARGRIRFIKKFWGPGDGGYYVMRPRQQFQQAISLFSSQLSEHRQKNTTQNDPTYIHLEPVKPHTPGTITSNQR
ncbi:UNVERIFIED_CONTAM: hypothetical protein K2H54_071701 [Gekko kuhli]